MAKFHASVLEEVYVRVLATMLLAAMMALPLAASAAEESKGGSSTRGAESAQPGGPSAQDASYDQNKYPGAPPSKAKLQTTIGNVKLSFYGTLLLNISTSDSVQVGQDIPLWPLPGNVPISFPDGTTRRAGLVSDTIFTARQTVLGFQVAPAKPLDNGWNPSGVVEFDFFGSRPVDPGLQPQDRVLNQPRLRVAYFQIEKGEWRVVAGQDKIIISPLDPISLSHVAVPLGASAGDLWGWLPQVRVENTRKFGETTTLFQFGVLRPSFGDPRLGDQNALVLSPGSAIDSSFSGFGERANQPFYQGRIALSHPMDGSTATVGAGAHYGRERIGADRTLDSWAFAVDAHLPLYPRLILRGEAYVGSNLVPFDGGIIQGAAAEAATGALSGPAPFKVINKIGDGGGWGEVTVPITLDYKNIFYAGAGTDDPKDRDLLPGTGRSKNSFVWASYFRKITSDVTAAFEWSFWDFRTRGFTATGALGPRGTSGRGNVLNIALAYQF